MDVKQLTLGPGPNIECARGIVLEVSIFWRGAQQAYIEAFYKIVDVHDEKELFFFLFLGIEKRGQILSNKLHGKKTIKVLCTP